MRRITVASIVSGAMLAGGALAISGAYAATGTLPPPADLQVVDLTPESVTVTWDAVPEAQEYSVSINSSGTYCPGGGRTVVTADRTAAFTGLTWDCSYSVSVRARDLSGYPWRYSDFTRVTFRTPLPDDYVFPGPPSDFRVDLNADGEISGLGWEPATVGIPPLIYNVYMELEPDVGLSGPIFTGLSETFVRDDPTKPYDGLKYLNGILQSERPDRVTLWVTTVDVIKYPITKESAPSNRVVLDCRDVVCQPVATEVAEASAIPIAALATTGDATTLDDLRELVRGFEAGGEVTFAGARRLEFSLLLAEHSISRGTPGSAILALEDFKRTASEPRYVPSPSAQTTLIAAADALIAKLRAE